MADVGGGGTRPEHVVSLGGARTDHSGEGNSMFPPVEKTLPGAATAPRQRDRVPTTPTTVAKAEASLIVATNDNGIVAGDQVGATPTSTSTSTTPTTAGAVPTSTTTTTVKRPVAEKPVHIEGMCDGNGDPLYWPKPPPKPTEHTAHTPKKPKPTTHTAHTPKKPKPTEHTAHTPTKPKHHPSHPPKPKPAPDPPTGHPCGPEKPKHDPSHPPKPKPAPDPPTGQPCRPEKPDNTDDRKTTTRRARGDARRGRGRTADRPSR